MGKCYIFGHLEYFTNICDILQPFGSFCAHLVHFFIMPQEVSGNPVKNSWRKKREKSIFTEKQLHLCRRLPTTSFCQVIHMRQKKNPASKCPHFYVNFLGPDRACKVRAPVGLGLHTAGSGFTLRARAFAGLAWPGGRACSLECRLSPKIMPTQTRAFGLCN
jgi:hypothetical protein